MAENQDRIITNTITGSIVTFNDGAVLPLEKCEVALQPIQSLNGYSSPWVGGAGKNLLNYEAWKTVGTYHGTSVFENNGVTITATTNDCYTQWQDNVYPVGARIPISEGETITLSWETTDTVAGTVYIFPNGTTTGMVNKASTNLSVSYTATSGITYVSFRMGVTTSGTTIHYKNIMARKSGDSTWTPYSNNKTNAPVSASKAHLHGYHVKHGYRAGRSLKRAEHVFGL